MQTSVIYKAQPGEIIVPSHGGLVIAKGLPERRGPLKLGGAGGWTGFGGRILPQAAISCANRMGKGLREPVAPYRQAYVFGADLNVPNANNWNAVPEAMDPTNTFDLSSLTPNHEVVVAELVAFDIPAGVVCFADMEWHRGRDDAFLFSYPVNIPDALTFGYSGWAWYYIYSYIGYVPWEISENGGYYLDLTFSGPATYYTQRLTFTVTGIPSTPALSGFKISDFAKV